MPHQITSFIIRSPYHALLIILLMAAFFCFTVAFFVIRAEREKRRLKSAVLQQQMEAHKATEAYRAQFKHIHQVRQKFKKLKATR